MVQRGPTATPRFFFWRRFVFRQEAGLQDDALEAVLPEDAATQLLEFKQEVEFPIHAEIKKHVLKHEKMILDV